MTYFKCYELDDAREMRDTSVAETHQQNSITHGETHNTDECGTNMAQEALFVREGAFRLMDLPPELRNAIYAFALPQQQTVDLPHPHIYLNRRDPVPENWRFPTLSIMHLNKQIRNECCGLLYGCN